MDLSVVKTVFGDFSTFVDSIVKLVNNFPVAIANLQGLEKFSS